MALVVGDCVRLFDVVGETKLEMVWPSSRLGQPPEHLFPTGYGAKVLVNRAEFTRIQEAAGWTMREGQWEELTDRLVPNSMIFTEHSVTQELVAVCCGERTGPESAELAWLAVVPEHRGKGLGLAACSALTRHLLGCGYERLHGSTQEHRLVALRIYLTLGFQPTIDPETADGWRRVWQKLGLRPLNT